MLFTFGYIPIWTIEAWVILDVIIVMPSQENTQELSGAPHPYTKNIRKKFPENQKNPKFRDVKPGFPIYFRVKFREKIPKNVSVVKKLLPGKKCIQTVFCYT